MIANLLMNSQAIVLIETQTAVVFGDAPQAVRDKSTGLILIRRKVKPVMHTRNGSGVIISDSGLIVTNAHIVLHAGRILVTLSDNTKEQAFPIQVVPEHDLAVIKINSSQPLKCVRLADSNKIRLDDRVFTIGSSLVLRNSLSEGRITGLGINRQQNSKNPALIDLIQVNFDVYQGDSGSPLFNSQGELIGIMAAAATTQSKTAYAIPANKIAGLYQSYLKSLSQK